MRGVGLTFVPVKADALSLLRVRTAARDISSAASTYLRTALPNLHPPLHAASLLVVRCVRVLLRCGSHLDESTTLQHSLTSLRNCALALHWHVDMRHSECNRWPIARSP